MSDMEPDKLNIPKCITTVSADANSRKTFCACILIGALILSPYSAVAQSSQLWRNLFGAQKMGASNWILTLPTPFVTLLMLKAENLFSIRKRLFASWALQIPVSFGVAFFPYRYFTDHKNTHFYFFLASVFCTAFLFAVAQSSFFSFCSLLPEQFVKAVPAGMSIAGLLTMLAWLILSSTVEYKRSPLSLLLAFNGIVVVSMFVCIAAFLYLTRAAFTKKFIAPEKRKIVTFAQLFFVWRKIRLFSLLIGSLMAINFLFSPTLCFGFKSSAPMFRENWGSILLLNIAFFSAASRVLTNCQPKFFCHLFGEKFI
ncbi:hypothetical protein MHBO_003997, partial [Bonamia ostreae]